MKSEPQFHKVAKLNRKLPYQGLKESNTGIAEGQNGTRNGAWLTLLRVQIKGRVGQVFG